MSVCTGQSKGFVLPCPRVCVSETTGLAQPYQNVFAAVCTGIPHRRIIVCCQIFARQHVRVGNPHCRVNMVVKTCQAKALVILGFANIARRQRYYSVEVSIRASQLKFSASENHRREKMLQKMAEVLSCAHLLRDLGLREQAIFAYRVLLAETPTLADAHAGLACVYYQQRRLTLAAYHFQQALANNPKLVECHANLGHVLRDMGRHQDAHQSFYNALTLADKNSPRRSDYENSLACQNKDMALYEEAASHFRESLAGNPANFAVLFNLVHTSLYLCDWKDYDERMQLISTMAKHQLQENIYPCIHPHHSFLFPVGNDFRRLLASAHAEAAVSRVPGERRVYTFEHLRNHTGPLNIGYVSSDFKDHPTAHLMLSVPRNHDRKRVTVHMFSLSALDRTFFGTEIFKGCDHFHDLSKLSYQQAADLIYSCNIHVLVDLNGYTRGACNELWVCKPAPIQCLWLGYPGTSGAACMDYFIGDSVATPPDSPATKVEFSEKIVCLPHTFFVGDHAHMFPIVNGEITWLPALSPTPQPPLTRAFYGLPSGVVFFNFNQLYKIDPQIFDCWMRILNQTTNSVLWLLRFPADGEQRLRQRAAAAGIEQGRLVFSNVCSKVEHVRRGSLADVCLDTRLCSGHTTCMDALWGGTPVLTLPGETVASRIAASQLTALGVPELICSSLAEYETKAVELARSPRLLQVLKQRVRAQRLTSPLFNTKLRTQHLEDAFETMVAAAEF